MSCWAVGGREPVTFSAHFLMTVASSETTRSTHFKLGSLSLTICFFTMASKAMSGVKRPVLATCRRAGRGRGGQGQRRPHTYTGVGRQAERQGWGQREGEREGERKTNQLVSACAQEPGPHLPRTLLGTPE